MNIYIIKLYLILWKIMNERLDENWLPSEHPDYVPENKKEEYKKMLEWLLSPTLGVVYQTNSDILELLRLAQDYRPDIIK